MRRLAPWLAGAALVPGALLPAACGGGGSAAPSIEIPGKAKQFELTNFQPAGPVKAGKPTTVSFTITQPDGKPMTQFATGSGPHTRIHLIMASEDLSTIVHRHPPIDAAGKLSETVTFKKPGRYRVVMDVYPKNGTPKNFQLFKWITVAGPVKNVKLPPFTAVQVVEGYTFTMHPPKTLKAIEAALIDVTVTDPNGKPAVFQNWLGALAHAIFFRAGTLDYFHTHVCAPGAIGCTSLTGGAKVTGTGTPGKLTVGVLVPVPGTWKLFLQTKIDGKVLTVPYTLKVTG